jgi:glycosyltransferase involved in cell wall biosynthesis
VTISPSRIDRSVAVSSRRLTVVRSGLRPPDPEPGEVVVSDGEVRQWVLRGGILRHVRRYHEARLVTERLATSGRPMLLWPLSLMARNCSIVDTEGRQRTIGVALLVRWTMQVCGELIGKRALFHRIDRELASLERGPGVRAEKGLLNETGNGEQARGAPLYLRTDLSFGVRAGGSVGHIAGVLGELSRQVGPPVLMTTAVVPTLTPGIEVHLVGVPEAFWNFRELPSLALNDVIVAESLAAVAGRRISMVYQRYSLNSYAGLRLASRLGVPLVIEYNGSEIWMSRHWGHPLKYEDLSSRIELLNMNHADLVVVVSSAMRDELVARGVSSDRILVNPNGVDPVRYSPAVDGNAVRSTFGFGGNIVIGFISTFQPWHGAQVLARAFVRLMHAHPEYRQSVRLLMIGSGSGLEEAMAIVKEGGVSDRATFTGLIPQEDGPGYLAACDILASPHVPNPDGTPFFGSPTKLFEYMAMGRAIVASDLDQIGEVLRHGETAWMVPPADSDALAAGLDRLISDRALRQVLGDAARREAVAHHTWRAHVDRILEALDARVRHRVA